jgi:hypothetical protein
MQSADRVPSVSDHGPGVDQGCAGKRVWADEPPAQSGLTAKVMKDEMGAADFEALENCGYIRRPKHR